MPVYNPSCDGLDSKPFWGESGAMDEARRRAFHRAIKDLGRGRARPGPAALKFAPSAGRMTL